MNDRPKRPGAELTGYDVEVRFPPKVLHLFNQLAVLLEGSKHFSPEILENLQEYATGKPMNVQRALSGIAFVMREGVEHVYATGDKKVKDVISDLQYELSEGDPPISLSTPPRTRGRG